MSRRITPEEDAAARRLMDCVKLHVVAELAAGHTRDTPAFIAVRLADGSSPDNNTLYDSRADAARHHRHEAVMFIKIGHQEMPYREALIVLQQHRQAFRSGHRFVEEDVITPHLTELLGPLIPRTLKGLSDGHH